MFYTPIYQGDGKTLFSSAGGLSFELSENEIQSLFDVLRLMDSVDGSIPEEMAALHNKVSDLEDERDALQRQIDVENHQENYEELKHKILELAEELR